MPLQKRKKILIAEDEAPMARALGLKLGRAGFEINTVSNGEEALEILASQNFDLLLLDLMMPKIDGFGVLSRLKEKGVKIPVIITSNLSQEEDAKRAKKLGAMDYIIKSNTPIAKVVEKVNKLLNL
jgi:DNA-binding response OmpR family regulator